MAWRFEGISPNPSYCDLVAEKDVRVLGMVGLHKGRYTIRKPPHTDGGCPVAGILLPGRLVKSFWHRLQPRANATIPATIAPAASSLL